MDAWLLPAVGVLTGLHAATWGGFKDSRFEGFHVASFVRSVWLGVLVSLPVGLLIDADPRQGVLVAIGLCYATERLVTEWWKAILREDRQDCYAIPMRLAVGGRTVETRPIRYAAGLAIVGGLFLACVTTTWLQSHSPAMPGALLVALGGIGGWLTAVGGAWKDAPIEGFQRYKFLRSPFVATTWALVLLPFTRDLPVLAVAAGGCAVATIETYKTFLAGGPPGKFAAKPVRHPCDGVRRACRTAHAALYALLGCVLAVAVLRHTLPGEHPRSGETSSLLVVLVLSSVLATRVLSGPGSASVDAEQSGGRSRDRARERVSHADLRRTVS